VKGAALGVAVFTLGALGACAEFQTVCPDGTAHRRRVFSGGSESEWCHRDDDVREGPEVRYFESGVRMLEGGYLDGVRHGEWRYYTNARWLWRVDRWEDGALVDKKLAPPPLDPNGSPVDVLAPTESDVIKLASADPNLGRAVRGHELPPFAMWYADGKPRVLGHYDGDGLRTGTWRFWHRDGGLAREIDYDAGVRQRFFREWHPNGQRKTDGAYVVGERDGRWRRWDEAGHLLSDQTFGHVRMAP
jgi:antitoxin component YwqK of YwqJK toxin-antitoxin module